MISQTTVRSARPRIAVLTVVSGEHDQLLSQVDGLAVSTWPPDLHVVTSVRDRTVTRGRLPIRSDRWDTVVPVLPVPRSRDPFLPGLQAAGQAALDGGADVLIFLSVGCIPSSRLLQIFTEAATNGQTTAPTLWHSSVSGLSPAPSVCYPVAGGMDALRADRDETTDPVPVPGQRWRHSFAMTARDWQLVLPAVHSAHPFGMASSAVEDVFTASSVRLRQVPGATAYQRRPHLRDRRVPASA